MDEVKRQKIIKGKKNGFCSLDVHLALHECKTLCGKKVDCDVIDELVAEIDRLKKQLEDRPITEDKIKNVVWQTLNDLSDIEVEETEDKNELMAYDIAQAIINIKE
jgi:hypothetical protein